MKPYILWFGKFKDKSIELMMFDPKGYSYLLFILTGFSDKPGLLARVRDVMQRGEQPRIQTKCPVCGTAATHVIAAGNNDEGYYFASNAWCEEHCPRTPLSMYVPLKFSSLSMFRLIIDQQQFMRQLRKHCGLSARLTAIRATDFFFSE